MPFDTFVRRGSCARGHSSSLWSVSQELGGERERPSRMPAQLPIMHGAPPIRRPNIHLEALAHLEKAFHDCVLADVFGGRRIITYIMQHITTSLTTYHYKPPLTTNNTPPTTRTNHHNHPATQSERQKYRRTMHVTFVEMHRPPTIIFRIRYFLFEILSIHCSYQIHTPKACPPRFCSPAVEFVVSCPECSAFLALV